MAAIKNKFLKKWPFFIIPLLSFLLVILLTQELFFSIKPLKDLELKYLDLRFLERGPREITDSSDVIILSITRDDYNQIPEPYNSWPWPRSYFAKVIKNLNVAGVRAIGIDLLMADDDQFSLTNDSILFTAIKEAGNVVVAGEINTAEEARIERGNVKYKLKGNIQQFRNKFFAADSSIGIAQLDGDQDGIYRRYEPFAISEAEEIILPTFGFALLGKFFGLKSLEVAKLREGYFEFAQRKIPRFDISSMLINYYGPNGTFKYVKFSDILDDKEFNTSDEIYYETDINAWDDPYTGLLQSGLFKDKIVIIGSTMVEDKDFHPISLALGKRRGDNQMFGVEIHANALQNILWNDYLYKQSKSSEIFLILILSFLTFFVFSFLKNRKLVNVIAAEVINIIILFLLFVVIYQLGIYLFINNNYVIAFISPVSAIVVGYFSSTVYHFVAARKQNVLIKGMFGHYVSKTLVNELLLNPDKLALGGEKKYLTILFSDIEGFTTISEGMTPERLVEFVNNYLSIMTSIVLKNKGTLDKYLGDSLMAFWGAPIEVEDQELMACKTAIEMQGQLESLKDEWAIDSEKEIKTRIGIHSGEVVVGNIGGEDRFDYTVMGDSVNLASRLEGVNKIYGTGAMISHVTYEQVKDSVLVREIDKIIVKGKTKPTTVYEIIGLSDDEKAVELLKQYDLYLKGHKEYLKRNFKIAIEMFEKAFAQNEKDLLSKLYIERCKEFLDNPPPEDWGGVHVLTTK